MCVGRGGTIDVASDFSRKRDVAGAAAMLGPKSTSAAACPPTASTAGQCPFGPRQDRAAEGSDRGMAGQRGTGLERSGRSPLAARLPGARSSISALVPVRRNADDSGGRLSQPGPDGQSRRPNGRRPCQKTGCSLSEAAGGKDDLEATI